ncbi:hypothetical protein BDR03DRAFT_985113 [Suillus americanus]|nr:hypothetical protein BDR03DRAFT_985113 [Suillus americanus]
MSYPRDNPENPSVNAGIDPDAFPTEWGTFDSVVELILSLPDGQQWALCILWRDRIYADRALMFGLSSSAGVFGSVADMLVAIYFTLHAPIMQKYGALKKKSYMIKKSYSDLVQVYGHMKA